VEEQDLARAQRKCLVQQQRLIVFIDDESGLLQRQTRVRT
jgi:hypothetical protein